MENQEKTATVPAANFAVKIPEIKEFLKAGVQFGHETKKWNPLMRSFIFTQRNNIHIIDVSKTVTLLEKAANFLAQAASRGNILFVGTKRQASEIVRKAAIDSGSLFVTHRWPGGLLTNLPVINKSLKKFATLEQEFESGVQNRTKFEVSKMKKEWERMNRLYEGLKKLDKYPEAMVVVDTNYEHGAIREAKRLHIPLVAMVDTNCDPNSVDYAIPANDDALKSIELVMQVLSAAVSEGNKGKGIKHEFRDYTKVEVQVVKVDEKEEAAEIVDVTERVMPKEVVTVSESPVSHDKKGILEKVKDDAAEKAQAKSVKKTAAVKAVKAEPVVKAKKSAAVKAKAAVKSKTKKAGAAAKKPVKKTKAAVKKAVKTGKK